MAGQVARQKFGAPYLTAHRADLHNLLRCAIGDTPLTLGAHCVGADTVNGGAVVDLAREHSAALIRQDLFGSQAPPAEAERRIQTVAELGVRIVLSFILTPPSAIPMDTLEDARAFARDLIAPVHLALLSEKARSAAGP